jgi:hypothetical protein
VEGVDVDYTLGAGAEGRGLPSQALGVDYLCIFRLDAISWTAVSSAARPGPDQPEGCVAAGALNDNGKEGI